MLENSCGCRWVHAFVLPMTACRKNCRGSSQPVDDHRAAGPRTPAMAAGLTTSVDNRRVGCRIGSGTIYDQSANWNTCS